MVFGIMLIAAVMETVGIASILPFIAVLSNPSIVEESGPLNAVYTALGFTETEPFLVFLGFAFFVLFIFGLIMRTLSFWVQARFANSRMYSISSRVFFGYLCKDYTWYLKKNTARLASSVLSEVDRAISGALFPGLQLIAHVTVSILLLALLVVVDPLLALSMISVLGACYAAIFWVFKRRADHIGIAITEGNRGRYLAIQEALGGIKDLKMKGLEISFLQRFQHHTGRFAKSRVSQQLMGQLPSYGMQGVIFGGFLLMILYLMVAFDDFDAALPVIAMYAVAGYRLMPSLQNGYRHLISLRSSKPVVDSLHADLKEIEEIDTAIARVGRVEPVPLRQAIELDSVSFRYPGAEDEAIQQLQLTIPRSSTVAFVGPSGCGKTTTIDMILGLLIPTEGAVRIDATPLCSKNVRGWQRNIGYVPQDIYLADKSIASNIAYGLPDESIDHAAVERASRIANLHTFVTETLPEGYETIVGERGVRLSGGQKQRIGIARALYYDPDVLVLDEATSALDNLSEHAVMQAVRDLAKKKTIILIAHRLSTVEDCDTIFVLDNGRLIAQGTYSDLMNDCAAFRKMANATSLCE
jgi:ABC-type multidrug transport system fused ATPase/permease subunit